MKKRIILCLSFLLVGCNNSNIQQSIISNDQSFTNDLASLFDFNDEAFHVIGYTKCLYNQR